MVTMLGLLLTALLLVVGPAPAAAADPILVPAAATPWPGKIFVSHDEWALSDDGFRAAPDAARLAQNLGRWFAVQPSGPFPRVFVELRADRPEPGQDDEGRRPRLGDRGI